MGEEKGDSHGLFTMCQVCQVGVTEERTLCHSCCNKEPPCLVAECHRPLLTRNPCLQVLLARHLFSECGLHEAHFSSSWSCLGTLGRERLGKAQ